MLVRTCVCCLLLAANLGFAASLRLDQLTVGSHHYKDVKVLGANKTDLYFTHAEGIANVKLKLLSPELQKRFNYDAKAAAEAEKQQAREDSLYHTTLAADLAAQVEKKAREAKIASRTSEDSLADPISDNSLLGKAAPKLEFEKWLSDKPDLDGKFVLVTFWAPWSVPSRKALTELNAIQKKFSDKMTVVAVAGEPESDIENTPEARIEFASALDPKKKVFSAAGVTSVPSAMLIDPRGVVLYQGHPGALTEAKLGKLLQK